MALFPFAQLDTISPRPLLVIAGSKADTAAAIGGIVHVLDSVAYAASVFVIGTACLVAASVPAARAARLDPTQALRQE